MNPKNKFSLSVLLITFALLASSCAELGNFQSSPDIASGFGSSRANDGPPVLFQELQLTTVVVDGNSLPLPGVTVKARSDSGGEITGLTDKRGKVKLPLIVGTNEAIDFSFTGGAAGNAEQTVKPGIVLGAQLEMRFKLHQGKSQLISKITSKEQG